MKDRLIFKTITVKWVDSNMQWEQSPEIIGLAILYTSGFLIRETETAYSIALEIMEINGKLEYRNQVSIPKSCVIKKYK